LPTVPSVISKQCKTKKVPGGKTAGEIEEMRLQLVV